MSSNWLSDFFQRGRKDIREGAALYRHLMGLARREVFYAALGVPDTPEGRFELLTLHAWLALRGLREDAQGSVLGKTMLEALFAQLDADLRETGIGDMGVPHRMRKLARTFYSRLTELDEAIDDEDALKTLLQKTLYVPHAPDKEALTRMARWLMTASRHDASFDFPEP